MRSVSSSNDSDVMAHKKRIEESSKALLLDHGIHQKKVFHWVRDAMKECVADLPNVPILYNKAHGGYSLSKEFALFVSKYKTTKSKLDYEDCNEYEDEETKIEGDSSSDDDYSYCSRDERITNVQYIIPFAVSILEDPQYSGLKEILWTYHTTNIAHVFNLAQRLLFRKKDNAIVLKNVQRLREYLENPSSTYGKNVDVTNNIHYFQYSDSIGFEKYTKDALKQVIDVIDSSVIQDEHGTKNPVLHMEALVNELEKELLNIVHASTLTAILEFIQTYNKSRGKVDRVSEMKTLLYMLQQKGYRNPYTWAFQGSYHERAIVYLITQPHPQWVTAPESNPSSSQMEPVYEHFGLACASGKYCNLAIEKVPALMSWCISEYDGKEKIYID